LDDFVPEANTGLTDPNIIDAPGTPVITTNPLTDGTVRSFKITSTVPATGTVLYMDFNYGTSSDPTTHKLYKTVSQGNGLPYNASSSVSIDINDLPPASYYTSVTARNNQAGRLGPPSAIYIWGGPNVTTFDANANLGGLNLNNFNSTLTVEQSIVLWTISIPNVGANTVTLPIDIDIAPVNVPVYQDGTTVPASQIYPYYQGTSSTVNGYLANSTGSFTPAYASILKVTGGQDGWQPLSYETTTGITTFTTDNYLHVQFDGTFVANANTRLQIIPFYTQNTFPGYFSADTNLLQTVEMIANTPTYVTAYNRYSADATIDGGGVLIRNIVGGTRITNVYCENELLKGVFPL
jgi:hypothetical protein